MASKGQVQTLISTNLPDNASPKIRSVKHREVENAILDYATNIIKMTSVSGTTITNTAMANREVGAIIIDDYTKNQGFTKTLSGTVITFTDGTELSNGQTITILLA